MAFKSEAQIVTLLQELSAIAVNFQSAMTTFESDFNDLSEAIDAGDDAPEDQTMYNQLSAVRNAYGAVWQNILELMRTAAPALGRLASCPDLSDRQLCLDYFRQYMGDNSETILDGDIVKDTNTTIGGTSAGNGDCTMTSTDVKGNKIDVGHKETLSLVCIRDYSQGATAGAEVFEIRGEDNSNDYPWDEGGSGINGASYDYPYGNVRDDFGPDQLRAVSGGTIPSIGPGSSARNLIRNGDFQQAISGTGSAKLPQWTINSGDGDVAQEEDTADILYGSRSINATADFQMDHFLAQGRLRPRAAYGLSVMLERVSSADGTLTVKIMDSDEGTTHATLTQDVSSLSNDTPTLVTIDPAIIPDNAEDLKIQVELASNTTGTVRLGYVTCGAATLIDGYLVCIWDGTYLNDSGYAVGRFKNGDQFDIVTTAGTAGEGEIQHYVFNRPWGRYMPSAEAPTWNDHA